MKRSTGPIDYSVYAAGLATTLCGQAALSNSVGDHTFSTVTATFLFLGYGVSIGLRRLAFKARLVELVVVAAAITIYIEIISGRSLGELIAPSAAGTTPELKLACLLLWLEVLRSFTLVSDEAVIFSGIPAVVLISLASTATLSPVLMALFLIFLATATFLLAYRPHSGRRQILPSSRTALATAILALTIGGAMVVPVRYVCSTVFAAAMPGFTHVQDTFTNTGYSDGSFLQIAQGPITLSNTTVFTIKTWSLGRGDREDTFWRGRVFDKYTGHGWEASSGFRIPMERLAQVSRSPQKWEFDGKEVDPKRILGQIVHVELLRGSTVYAAAEPLSANASVRLLQNETTNCWQSVGGPLPLSAYTAISLLPITDPMKLRHAGRDRPADQMYPPEILAEFTQTPSTAANAGVLARRITRRLHNSYDKAKEIERYIGENCVYNLDSPRTPSNADPVDFFLFHSKQGYCDVFASAMVVMCREIGIPARLATGFATGEFDASTGQYRVRDMDRHAWPEVYFPECGWVPFDPTSYTTDTNTTWLSQIQRQLRLSFQSTFSGPAVIPLALGLILIVAVAAFSSDIRGALYRRRRTAPSRLHAGVVARYSAIRKTLGVTGKHLTPYESALAADLSSEEARAIAAEATALFAEIRYGKREIAPDDLKRLDELNRGLRSAMRARKRM